MKIKSSDFRVREGDGVNLKKRPTLIDPIYKSKEQYAKLLTEHVEQLSAMQQLHYSTNSTAILLLFSREWTRQEKTELSST